MTQTDGRSLEENHGLKEVWIHLLNYSIAWVKEIKLRKFWLPVPVIQLLSNLLGGPSLGSLAAAPHFKGEENRNFGDNTSSEEEFNHNGYIPLNKFFSFSFFKHL